MAKKNFYTYAGMSARDKELFKDNISKITLLYQLATNKTNISAYKDEVREYPLINIFKVELNIADKLKRIAEIIMKSIPYPMLLVFEFENKVQLWTAHQRINQNDETKNVLDDFIYTDWQTDTCWFDLSKMNMTNFYALYSDMVDAISIKNAEAISNAELTGEQARELTAKIDEIDSRIELLKARMKKETQFNKRVEINIEIKELENLRRLLL